MSEFSELVKRFDKIRYYVRDFYIYGFKTREDYQEKSGRTYDNERRRIESWFSDYISSDYNSHKKKSTYITIDSGSISVNPLYSAWKSKSFTSNDIMLHFFLLDLFQDGEPRNVEDITDEILLNYSVLFDVQTVRKKLSEYEALGLISITKSGKQYLYQVNQDPASEIPTEIKDLLNAVRFFQAAAPFGFVGSTILDSRQTDNTIFRFKHDYLVHTLEDEILILILDAIEQCLRVSIVIKSSKNHKTSEATGTPLKILVSTQTGRRYLCMHSNDTKRFTSYRLDSVKSVTFRDKNNEFHICMQEFEKINACCWGVSFGNSHKAESIIFTLSIDEKRELYIVNRLEREGRNGSVVRLEENIWQYRGDYWDSNELLPWVKTFTGRILSFQSSNPSITRKFYRDMSRMSTLYFTEETEDGHET